MRTRQAKRHALKPKKKEDSTATVKEETAAEKAERLKPQIATLSALEKKLNLDLGIGSKDDEKD